MKACARVKMILALGSVGISRPQKICFVSKYAVAVRKLRKSPKIGAFSSRQVIVEEKYGGEGSKKRATYSYVTLEQRILAEHPARASRAMVDRALARWRLNSRSFICRPAVR